jgi:hypothetical protein
MTYDELMNALPKTNIDDHRCGRSSVCRSFSWGNYGFLHLYMLVFPRVSVNWLLGYQNNVRILIYRNMVSWDAKHEKYGACHTFSIRSGREKVVLRWLPYHHEPANFALW